MAEIDQNLAFEPATVIGGLIKSKELSPVEITKLYLERIEKLDSNLNSYLTVTADTALRAAQIAEDKVLNGDELGALHGIPISIKDLQMTKGIRTTGGSLAYSWGNYAR